MFASLSSPDFAITRNGNDDGILTIPEKGTAEWSWNVIPQSYGDLQLELQIYAVNIDNGQKSFVATFRQTINASVNPGFVANSAIRNWLSPLGITASVIVAAVLVILKLLWNGWRNGRDEAATSERDGSKSKKNRRKSKTKEQRKSEAKKKPSATNPYERPKR
jgi:hypothetical protein